MSTTTAGTVAGRPKRGFLDGLIHRQLESYPDTGPRIFYLLITVLATAVLYYELYASASVATLQLIHLHMSFTYYVTILAVANLVGAFGSLLAGLTDRLGRCNLVVVGLLLTGVMTAVVIPAITTSKSTFFVATCVVGLVEGICLVATPALIRDFSPQLGRATAMGFWTMGPVLGSLIVSVVGTNTITSGHLVNSVLVGGTTWQYEYRICGVVGLVMFVVALLFLRELSPGLRDQLMVSVRDRALIEAKAKGLDIEDALRQPFRQMMRPDVLISAVGIAVFLLIYYTAVGFATIYFQTSFRPHADGSAHFTLSQANGLGNWNWGFNLLFLVLIGAVSDKARVRKPFMIIGGIGAAVMIVIFLNQAGTGISYYHLAIIIALLAGFLGVAYTPWMASFTETVESHNPALTATGLAVWGWIIRVIIFSSYIILPHVITTTNPLVNNGPEVQAAAAKYAPELAFAQTHPQVVATAQQLAPELAVIHANPKLFAQLAANPSSPALQAQAVAAGGGGNQGQTILLTIATNQAAIQGLVPYTAQLTQLQSVAGNSDFKYVAAHGPAVLAAAAKTPGQWKNWYWVCFGGVIVFMLSVPLMRGRWSPKKAKADVEAHEQLVAAEMAKLHV